MPRSSAGILLYRIRPHGLEVLLIHPGGPFWAKKDAGAWSIPKGLLEAGEDTLEAARREFEEETGCKPDGDALFLGEFRQSSGKVLTVFAIEGDFDLAGFLSNSFTMEWPPKSGRLSKFPEADRAGWFAPAPAREKILKAQLPILEALFRELEGAGRGRQ